MNAPEGGPGANVFAGRIARPSSTGRSGRPALAEAAARATPRAAAAAIHFLRAQPPSSLTPLAGVDPPASRGPETCSSWVGPDQITAETTTIGGEKGIQIDCSRRR